MGSNESFAALEAALEAALAALASKDAALASKDAALASKDARLVCLVMPVVSGPGPGKTGSKI